MYRLLERSPASPKNSRTRQEQLPTKQPSKGKTGRGTCSRYGGNNHRTRDIWEASDQCRTARRHPGWGGVFALGRIARAVVRRFRRQGAKECTCQRGCFAVVSDLPIKRLTQATRKGQSKLAAEQGNLAGPIHPYQAARGESSHRKGITPRGRRRPPPFQSRRRPGKRAWQRVKMGRWSKSKAP